MISFMQPNNIIPNDMHAISTENNVRLQRGAVSDFLTSLAVIENPADYPSYESAVQEIIDLMPVLQLNGMFAHLRLRSPKAIALITDLFPELKGIVD
jgi:hypothetical protein